MWLKVGQITIESRIGFRKNLSIEIAHEITNPN